MDIKHSVVLSTAFAVLVLSSGLSFFSTQPVLANKTLSQASLGSDTELETALKHHFEKRWFKLISASESQQKSLAGIIDSQVEQSRPLRQKVREQLSGLTDLMASDSASDKEIKDKMREIRDLRNQLQDMRIDTILRVRAELSPQQRQVMANRAKGFLSGNPRLGLLR